MANATATPNRSYVPFSPEKLKQIDAYRFSNQFPDRGSAIRHLVDLGLASGKKP